VKLNIDACHRCHCKFMLVLGGAGNEAHGGSTYTAIASLVLMGELDCLGEFHRTNLIRWCLMRQSTGYNGRTNKDNDSCYSFSTSWENSALLTFHPPENLFWDSVSTSFWADSPSFPVHHQISYIHFILYVGCRWQR
jgi:prenyltransferase beta subunit